MTVAATQQHGSLRLSDAGCKPALVQQQWALSLVGLTSGKANKKHAAVQAFNIKQKLMATQASWLNNNRHATEFAQRQFRGITFDNSVACCD